ncbi:DUF4374 domain-containing protein [Pedobacter rhizosphaerae]|uniref:DUF4374 domain-containing protein n=1 Tax=Pedobacter rhizosphaerae TaxID=390241 RepID=A0A1H9WAL9_9SPHI|nr:DUF4374 domain-containing protein [Pedobacter rhizosphaerae]SES30996.1 protein of unknown function [Pedobacter rhizosphaerae]
MINFLTRRFFILSLLVLMLFGAIGCLNKSDAEAKYSFYILAKDGNEYLLTSNSLTDGSLKPETDGVLLDRKDMDRDVMIKEGYYYHLNRKKGLFTKFKLEEGTLKMIDTLNLKDYSIENFNWLGKDTLLLTALNISGYNETKFALIDTKRMKTIRAGTMEIPKPSGIFTTLSIGLVEKRKNSLLVGYTYHHSTGISNYATSDTLYVSQLSYPDMELIKTEKDTRSTYPGGVNTIQSYNFSDAHQDYYFMSCPGIALGNRPEIPTGIFRIKANTDTLDRDYFFDISGSVIQNHAYGMWNLGNDKVIIRSERKDLFKGLGDHYSTAHFEFYELNLKSKAIKKLALPLDKGTRRECVLVEGNTAYIAVNSTNEGNYIWVYDVQTGALKKGLQLAGDTDFILRMDRL